MKIRSWIAAIVATLLVACAAQMGSEVQIGESESAAS